jgi:aspartyl protease family protein
MSKSLFFIIVAGATVGLALPSGRTASAPRPAAASGTPGAFETRIPRQRDGHFYVDATVNGRLVRFLVDTGATSVALTEEDAAHVGIRLDPARYEDVGRGASGVVRGQFTSIASIEIGGKRVANLRGAVIQGGEQSLLGQSYLAQLSSVEIRGDEMVLR